MQLDKIVDERYTIAIEYGGYFHNKPVPKGLKQGQRFIARFCGDFVGSDNTESGATLLCIFHEDDRLYHLLTLP